MQDGKGPLLQKEKARDWNMNRLENEKFTAPTSGFGHIVFTFGSTKDVAAFSDTRSQLSTIKGHGDTFIELCHHCGTGA